MAEKLVMLALSPTMETGTIARWYKKEGDPIGSGDLLCEVETDKATMDYESTTEGTLLKIVAGAGASVRVGDTIAVAGSPGEDISPILEEQKKKPESAPPVQETRAPQTSESPIPGAVSAEEHLPGGVRASPLARDLAHRLGVSLSDVSGSGPGGRIVKEDVEKASKAKQEAPSQKPALAVPATEEHIPISEKRRVIAQRLSESKFSAPHYYLTVAVNMDTIIAARQELNKRSSPKISFNAFLIKLVASALKKNPVVNSTWSGNTIVRHHSIDIGLAVAQSDGLITPIVRDCAQKGIVGIDEELRDLVARARESKLSPQEYLGASFTISNLGSYGVRQFTAIINPPGSAILAVGEIFKDPLFHDDGSYEVHDTILLTLSCDHRVIDGAVAAEFARDLKNLMESPISVLY